MHHFSRRYSASAISKYRPQSRRSFTARFYRHRCRPLLLLLLLLLGMKMNWWRWWRWSCWWLLQLKPTTRSKNRRKVVFFHCAFVVAASWLRPRRLSEVFLDHHQEPLCWYTRLRCVKLSQPSNIHTCCRTPSSTCVNLHHKCLGNDSKPPS